MSDFCRRHGMTLVISGPSGSGKSSLYKAASAKVRDLEFSVSCTTRAPRPGEQDGVDYYFISKEEFGRRVKNGDFAEHAEVHGNCYGTLKSELASRMKCGKDVILDIDVQGAAQLRHLAETDEDFRHALEFVFVAPPSFEELERRLRGRGTETEETVQRRLKNAVTEMKSWNLYDYLLINDDLQTAADKFIGLLEGLRLSTKRLLPKEN